MHSTTLVSGTGLGMSQVGERQDDKDFDHARGAVLDRSHSRVRTIRRSHAWIVPAAGTVALLLVGRPMALAPVTLTISATFASVIASGAEREGNRRLRGPLSAVAAIPAGFVVMVLTALTIGLLGGALQHQMWAQRSGALLTCVVVLAGTGGVCWRRGGRVVVVGPDWPALVGASMLGAFLCWVVTSQPFELWSRGMATGTDFLRHLGMARDVRTAGLLEPGALGYPRAFHATVAWLSSALGIDADAQTLWRAAQPLALAMLVVMLLAVMAIAGRGTRVVAAGSWPPVAASVAAGIAFVQTAWFSTYLAFGNVMNMIVGVALLAVLLTGLAVKPATLTAAVVTGGAVAVAANAWQILVPVAGLGCLPWAVSFLRQGWRDLRQWAAWVGMALLTLHGLLGVRATSVTDTASMPTVSNLFNPDWWWFLALGLSGLGAAVGYRRGERQWGASALGMSGGVVAMTAYLLWATNSTWELMLYYPVKAMWTAMVVLIPLAAVGTAVVVAGVLRYSGSKGRTVKLVTRVLILGLVGLTAAGVAGRGFAFRPHLVVMGTGGSGMPNWSLAVVDAMARVRIPAESRDGAILMGVVPSTHVQGLVGGFVGMADYMAMESLAHVGVEGSAAAPVKIDLARRDTGRICAYLREYPDALKVTGPNPQAGPGWLIDAGCPAAIVKPQQWVALEFDPDWLAQSPWQDAGGWDYPTVADYRAAKDGP